MKYNLLSSFVASIAVLIIAAPCQTGAAETYPTRSIRMIIPFSPSSGLDPVGRAIAERMQDSLRVPVVVENREGAGGQIGVSAGATSAADGYTITMVVHPPFAVQPYMRKTLPYDPLKLTPIARVVTTALMWVAPKDAPFKTFDEFVDFARANPDELTYGSTGIGVASYLKMESLKLALGLKIRLVPYKSNGQMMTDTISGRLSILIPSVAGAMPFITSGDVRPIAIGSPKRSALLPELPTLQEGKYAIKDFEAVVWYGFFGPPGLPQEITSKLASEIESALNTQQVQKIVATIGADTAFLGPQELSKLVERDVKDSRDLIRELQIPQQD